MFRKNTNVGQKSKCLAKIQMLVKNLNGGPKSKCWSKIEILVKTLNSQVESLVKERKFCKTK